MVSAGFCEEEVDDGVGILRGREHAIVILCHQSHAMTLEPLVGIAIVESLEESFQQSMATRVHLREIAHRGEAVGAVAASTT